MKKHIIIDSICVIITIIILAFAINTNNKNSNLSAKNSALNSEIEKVKNENSSAKNQFDVLNQTYESYKESMSGYENLSKKEIEAQSIAAESIIEASKKAEKESIAASKKAEEESIAESKKAKEESIAESKKAKKESEKAAKESSEAAKKQEYNTGITYNNLARNPDDYKGKKVKFTGKVIQVMENDDTIQIRFAVNSDYDDILLGEYSSSIVSSRILEDDKITIYGVSVGTISYTSTLGASITIPGVYISKIDQ